jgi:hypothetical protein
MSRLFVFKKKVDRAIILRAERLDTSGQPAERFDKFGQQAEEVTGFR